MQQKVKNISYLCKVSFKLDATKKELALLPAGSEVLSVNLEIVTPLAGATIDIGLEGKQDYFLDNINATNKGFSQSSILLTSATTQTINATITDPDPKADSLAILRVLYFLPSEVLLEC
ncbi:hypothetical protein HBZC1_00620 [Helicobacter bizzozeronii CIII-1]|uniref:Uncharacterized protein n=1 Tax=Helicobacter bizzozeronii (strain CIII-1) TaxID=1002804 RepID=F8KQP4_HELBC|nr:hypothetical protein [Helicobacter bizzozeronii]CCB79048.1 hypothetical protein HBZC1_00620 [Helicobacter bizzozeronii CIII-1]